jgi:hypothetical protein
MPIMSSIIGMSRGSALAREWWLSFLALEGGGAVQLVIVGLLTRFREGGRKNDRFQSHTRSLESVPEVEFEACISAPPRNSQTSRYKGSWSRVVHRGESVPACKHYVVVGWGVRNQGPQVVASFRRRGPNEGQEFQDCSMRDVERDSGKKGNPPFSCAGKVGSWDWFSR